MTRIRSILLTACVSASTFLCSPAMAQTTVSVERFGLYVVTDDLERAAAFYERLFGRPMVRVPGMVGFSVAGGLYSIVDRRTFSATVVPGDRMRGYMKVADTQIAYRRARTAVPDNVAGEVVTEGRFSFFKVRDPDGNLIEFYAVKAG